MSDAVHTSSPPAPAQSRRDRDDSLRARNQGVPRRPAQAVSAAQPPVEASEGRPEAPARPDAQISGNPEPKTATAKAKEEDAKAPGLRLHSGPPDYEKYRYGYPMIPGRMFGSGN